MKLTYSRLKKLLNYDPDSGHLTWICGGRGRPKGKIAGCKGRYIVIRVDGKLWPAHRLAWWLMTGELPDTDIDHKDEDKHNNKFDNLRLASRSDNMFNTSLRSDNTSGIKGVSWYEIGQCWRARLYVGGREVNLGHYKDKQEAANAVKRARESTQGDFVNHGNKNLFNEMVV